jgi:hypothetical protein
MKKKLKRTYNRKEKKLIKLEQEQSYNEMLDAIKPPKIEMLYIKRDDKPLYSKEIVSSLVSALVLIVLLVFTSIPPKIMILINDGVIASSVR